MTASKEKRANQEEIFGNKLAKERGKVGSLGRFTGESAQQEEKDRS